MIEDIKRVSEAINRRRDENTMAEGQGQEDND
jgi:hypothetical protein